MRNFRQKVYDRKKKFQEINLTQSLLDNTENNHSETTSRNDQDASRFDQDSPKSRQDFFQLHKNFKASDFFFLFRKVFAILLFGICTCLAALCVWKQSVPLYEAVGFSDPNFCALGAILMIVGFATIHSLTKSKIVLLFCIYPSEMKMQQGASERRVYKREAHTQATSNDAASSFPMGIEDIQNLKILIKSIGNK